MSRSPPPRPPRMPPAETALEQQILEVELRMLQRRRQLMSSWNEVEQTVAQVLAPRAWLWPLALGAAGGCLLGLLWRRGGRTAPAARAARRPAQDARPAEGGGRGAAPAFLGPWLRSLLTPLLHQWLRPAALQAAEALALALATSLLEKSSRRRGAAPRREPTSAASAGAAGPHAARGPE